LEDHIINKPVARRYTSCGVLHIRQIKFFRSFNSSLNPNIMAPTISGSGLPGVSIGKEYRNARAAIEHGKVFRPGDVKALKHAKHTSRAYEGTIAGGFDELMKRGDTERAREFEYAFWSNRATENKQDVEAYANATRILQQANARQMSARPQIIQQMPYQQYRGGRRR